MIYITFQHKTKTCCITSYKQFLIVYVSVYFQRYEELSIKWDQAREEVRLEDHEVLREKVTLQQELIRKQDEYAKNKRQQQIQAENEVRMYFYNKLIRYD